MLTSFRKYCNVYKSAFDTDDELKGAKKKSFDHKQFELGHKINKESKLNEKKQKS